MLSHRFHAVARTLAAATLRLGIAFVGLSGAVSLVHGANAGPSPNRVDAAQDTTPSSGLLTAPAQQGRTGHPAFDPTAERLKYLHDRLRITPAQEPLWANVAQSLRENAKAVAPLARERLQATPDRTAVETLGIYEKLGEVQMEGLKRFVAAFQALYTALSDQQKKIADVLFRTSPLGMVGSIPEFPEQLFELPLGTVHDFGGYPLSPPQPIYPPYEYGLPYPAYSYYPYYPAWIPSPPIGLGSPFFLLVPRHYHHHRIFLPPRPPFHVGVPPAWAPGMQRFHGGFATGGAGAWRPGGFHGGFATGGSRPWR
jgi:hypothetical protein